MTIPYIDVYASWISEHWAWGRRVFNVELPTGLIDGDFDSYEAAHTFCERWATQTPTLRDALPVRPSSPWDRETEPEALEAFITGVLGVKVEPWQLKMITRLRQNVYTVNVYWTENVATEFTKYTLEDAMSVLELALEAPHVRITMTRKVCY